MTEKRSAFILRVTLSNQISPSLPCNKTNRRTNFSKFIFVRKLYMFRAVSLPIIRSFPLYIRRWYMSSNLHVLCVLSAVQHAAQHSVHTPQPETHAATTLQNL